MKSAKGCYTEIGSQQHATLFSTLSLLYFYLIQLAFHTLQIGLKSALQQMAVIERISQLYEFLETVNNNNKYIK